MTGSDHKKGIFVICAAALLWSSGGVCIKLIQWNSLQIAGVRSIFAALTFLLLFRKQIFKVNPLTFLAAFCYTGILVLFVSATKLTTAANAIFLQYTAPIYVLVLEPWLLGTKLRRVNILTIILCFGGMALFFIDKISAGHMLGNILALTSGVAFAGFLLVMRKNKPEYQLPSIFWGNVFVIAACSFSFPDFPAFRYEDLLMTAFLGVFQIGIAYVLFSYGLKRVEAIEASLISMIEPVLNPVWVFLWYNEKPSYWAIVGGVIILCVITVRTVYIEGKKILA